MCGEVVTGWVVGQVFVDLKHTADYNQPTSLNLPMLHSTRPSILLLCLFFLLPSLILCATTQQSSIDIQNAIQSAILDGLSVVDHSIHSTYWYYLRGAKIASYNATIQKNHLNYIILYIYGSSVYRANYDLTFAMWEAELNSFVQVQVSAAGLEAIKSNISVLAQSNNYLDLTDSSLGIVASPPKSTENATETTQSSAPAQAIKNTTVNTNQTVPAQPIFPSAAGVIIIKPISNLSTNS